MNEWMMHLYSDLLCIVVHQKRFTIMCGGRGGDLSSTTTSVQHPLGWCDGCHRTTAPVRSPHTGYRWRGESHSANQVYALTKTSYRWRGERDIDPIKCMLSPNQLQVERRERHRPNQVYALTKTSYRWRGERDIDPIKFMRSPHTSYRWRGESHSANQVYALTTHQLQVERRES